MTHHIYNNLSKLFQNTIETYIYVLDSEHINNKCIDFIMMCILILM